MLMLRRTFLALFMLSTLVTGSAIASAPCPTPLLFWGVTGPAPGQFANPFGLDVADDGRVYVADQHNERVQVLSNTGTPLLQWSIPVGSNGYAYPTGICVKDGVVWVTSNQGQHVTRWTTAGGFLGYTSTPAGGWAYPTAIVGDASGNMYVCNSYYDEVIKLDSAGNYLSKWNVPGGTYDIDIDAVGDIYVGTYYSNRVYKYTSAGVPILSWGGPGSGAGQFNAAEGITHDASGDIYVCDTGNHRVQKFSPTGGYICSFGSLGSGIGQLRTPSDIDMGNDGDLYVCEFVGDRIHRWSFGAVATKRSTWGGVKSIYR